MGQGNGGGNSGGGGQGNGGGGKGKGKGKGHGNGGQNQPTDIMDLILQAARAGGKLAFGSALSENRDTQGQLRAQGPVIERAYDAYAQSIAQQQATQAAQLQQAQAGQAAAGAQLGAVGAGVTDAGAADAASRAAVLGQGSSVADTYRNLGGSAGLSRAELASAQVAQATDVGTANFTNLGSRAVTGERDRVQAHQDLRQMKLGNRQDRADLLSQKGAFIAQKFYEYMQQQEENAIAREGLAVDRRGQRLDAESDAAQLGLAQQTLAANISDDQADNALAALSEQHDHQDTVHDNQHTGGGGAGDTSGLSPSAQREYQKVISTVKGVKRTYEQMRANGLDAGDAKRRALAKWDVDSWYGSVAVQLAQPGSSLSPNGERLLRSHLPDGSTIPRRWR